MVTTLPRVHVAFMGMERIVADLKDHAILFRLLSMGAAAQEMGGYVSYIGGPAEKGRTDGPEAFHLIIVDNGRSEENSGGYGFQGNALLYPLRGLSQHVPGIWEDRRACLWFGLFGTGRRSGYAASHRYQPGQPTFAGRVFVRGLHVGLPGQYRSSPHASSASRQTGRRRHVLGRQD